MVPTAQLGHKDQQVLTELTGADGADGAVGPSGADTGVTNGTDR